MSDKKEMIITGLVLIGGCAVCAVATVYTYKFFGKIVAKEVVKLLV